MPLRFAMMASGRGSNALALLDAFDTGFIGGTVSVLVCNREKAPIIEAARTRGVQVAVIPSRGRTRTEHEALVLACLREHRADHILLAGYMRLLSPSFFQHFSGSILNIHPSLLPEFPGLDAATRQWEAKVKIAGATVHLVDEGIDSGPILLQGSLVVRGDEGAEGLTQRILTEVEHVIYPRAVRLFVDRLQRQKQLRENTSKKRSQPASNPQPPMQSHRS